MIGTDDDDTVRKIQQRGKGSFSFFDKTSFLLRKPVMPGLISSLDVDQDKIPGFQFAYRCFDLPGDIAVLRSGDCLHGYPGKPYGIADARYQACPSDHS